MEVIYGASMQQKTVGSDVAIKHYLTGSAIQSMLVEWPDY